MSKKLRVTQVHSAIGRISPQKKTIRALGLRKMGQTVVHNDTPSIRGMINKVKHLLTVTETDGDA
jgi:large subunit ribosomal protein L30